MEPCICGYASDLIRPLSMKASQLEHKKPVLVAWDLRWIWMFHYKQQHLKILGTEKMRANTKHRRRLRWRESGGNKLLFFYSSLFVKKNRNANFNFFTSELLNMKLKRQLIPTQSPFSEFFLWFVYVTSFVLSELKVSFPSWTFPDEQFTTRVF